MWFSLDNNGFQYLASKDSSWYLKLTRTNKVAFRILPYMPHYLVNPHEISNGTWNHAAVTVSHKFSYSYLVQYAGHSSDQQVVSRTYATVDQALQLGFKYLRDELQITVYVNGYSVITSVVWLSNTTHRLITDSTPPNLFQSFSVGNPAPAINNPINFGACMKTYSPSNDAVRGATRSQFVRNSTAYSSPSQVPCALVPFLTGTYTNAPISASPLTLDDLALMKSALAYYEEMTVAVQKKFVVENFANQDFSGQNQRSKSRHVDWFELLVKSTCQSVCSDFYIISISQRV